MKKKKKKKLSEILRSLFAHVPLRDTSAARVIAGRPVLGGKPTLISCSIGLPFLKD